MKEIREMKLLLAAALLAVPVFAECCYREEIAAARAEARRMRVEAMRDAGRYRQSAMAEARRATAEARRDAMRLRTEAMRAAREARAEARRERRWYF